MFIKKNKLKNQGRYSQVFEGILKGKKILIKENDNSDVNLLHEHLVSQALQKTKCKQFFCKSLFFSENLEKQTLILEWIDHIDTFYKYYKNEKISQKIINNLILHICFILKLAYQECQFNHNDLHLNNILIVKTKETFFEYEKNNKIRFFGVKPILIDFGFSHCLGVDGLKSCLQQTHYGSHPMISNQFFDLVKFTTDLLKIEHFIPKLNRRGEINLRASLFDYLCFVCRCSTYNREEQIEEKNDTNYETVWEKSQRSILTDNLNVALSNISLKSKRKICEFIENFQYWDGKLPVPRSIEQALLFHIDLYNNYYMSYVNNIFTNVNFETFFNNIQQEALKEF
jgi:hypothetical protein